MISLEAYEVLRDDEAGKHWSELGYENIDEYNVAFEEAWQMALKALLRYKPITLKETDAEPRTLKAILDTETSDIYIKEGDLHYWDKVRKCEVIENDT